MNMRCVESVKIVDGKCLNLEYHNRRAGFELPTPTLDCGFENGVVKWRVVYGDGLQIESQVSHYKKPNIRSLATIDGGAIDYSKKYENRGDIDRLFSLRGNCDDVLIIKDGMVSDTSFCNIVFENEYGLFTPTTPLLQGTKRQKLLDEGVIKECSIRVEDISKYCKAYLINAMIELEDRVIIKIENIKI